MKLDFRSRTTYTLTQYISEHLSDWDAEEYLDNNEDNFSEDLKDDLWNTFIEYPTEEMYDSRTKSDEIIMEAGKIDKEYTKYAGFNAKYNNDWNG